MLEYIFFFLLVVGLFIYPKIYFNKKNKEELNLNWLKIIKTVHFLSLIICVINAFLIIKYDLNFNRFWVLGIYFLTWLLIVFLTNNAIKTKLERIYNWLFVFFLFFSTPFILIGIITSNNGINYEDSSIRIETNGGLMMPPAHVIYQKRGLLEKFIYRSTFRGDETDSLSVNYRIDSTEITFFRRNLIENSLISDKKYKVDSIKVVFEKLNY